MYLEQFYLGSLAHASLLLASAASSGGAIRSATSSRSEGCS